MHANTVLPQAYVESTTLTIRSLRPDNPARDAQTPLELCAREVSRFCWSPIRIPMWMGFGGFRAPERLLPALCPGAN